MTTKRVQERTEKGAQSLERRQAKRRAPRRRTTNAITEMLATGERAEHECEIVTNDAEVDARMLAAKIAPTYSSMVAYFEHYGSTREEAHAHALDSRKYSAQEARTCPPQEQTWDRIGALGEIDLAEANLAWLKVQDYAYDELESGVRSAEAAGTSSPLERARFLALRDKFIDQWQPAGGIDAAMIDMLAQAYCLQLHWTEIAFHRATQIADSMRTELKRYESNGWKSPYQSAADAVDQAHRMADSWNRLFLRVLRQLRDLRRYAPPVIVNNGGQVNVANQQVNVVQPT
jgi:hypothetical protein